MTFKWISLKLISRSTSINFPLKADYLFYFTSKFQVLISLRLFDIKWNLLSLNVPGIKRNSGARFSRLPFFSPRYSPQLAACPQDRSTHRVSFDTPTDKEGRRCRPASFACARTSLVPLQSLEPFQLAGEKPMDRYQLSDFAFIFTAGHRRFPAKLEPIKWNSKVEQKFSEKIGMAPKVRLD